MESNKGFFRGSPGLQKNWGRKITPNFNEGFAWKSASQKENSNRGNQHFQVSFIR